MKLIPLSFRCRRNVRFPVLFVIFVIFSALTIGYTKGLGEFIVFSTLIPYCGYSIISIWRPSLLAFHYGLRKGTVDSELTLMAKKEDPRINAVVIKNLNRLYAYGNQVTNSIILSGKLFETLSPEEIKAVLYHEIGHGDFPRLYKRVLLSIFLIPIFILLYIIECTITYVVAEPFYPFLGAFIAPFPPIIFCLIYLAIERSSWAHEYKADAYAANKVGTRVVISALTNFIPPKLIDCDSPTHPSLRRRIAFLEAHKNNANDRQSKKTMLGRLKSTHGKPHII